MEKNKIKVFESRIKEFENKIESIDKRINNIIKKNKKHHRYFVINVEDNLMTMRIYVIIIVHGLIISIVIQ